MFSFTATMGRWASSSRRRLTLRRDSELLSLIAGVEMAYWYTSADEVNGDVLRVWDGVRREFITYAFRLAGRVDASAGAPPDIFSKCRCATFLDL